MYILLSDEVEGEVLSDAKLRWERYRQHLQSIRDRLPNNAYEFAAASWHYDTQDARCLHDVWVESLTICESASGDRHEKRRLEIHALLLGAYHNGQIALAYRGVQGYELRQPSGPNAIGASGPGHGDWIVDEIRLSDAGLVLHEVEFRWGARWLVECEDIEHEWLPEHV